MDLSPNLQFDFLELPIFSERFLILNKRGFGLFFILKLPGQPRHITQKNNLSLVIVTIVFLTAI